MGNIMIKHLALLVLLAIMSPFFIPSNAHGGINIDLNLPVGFRSISPAQFSVVRNDHFVLKGKLMGDFRISSVSIKGTEARIDEENGFEFSDIRMKEGLNTFLISMTDVNGRRRLVSYSLYSEPRGPMQGGGIAEGPVVDAGAAAEGYTAPPKKKLSTRVERRIEQPKEPKKGKDQDVVFSSPYSGQVITEKELKIGGRFNKEAGIVSITVNGQPCTLNRSAGTFEGPMLICPGKAREYNVNADSPKYVLMRVDPNTHSGENILKVKVTLDTGKSYEDRIIYYYYQLFMYSHTNNRLHVERSVENPLTGECVIVSEDYDYYNTDAFNSDYYQESPFTGWADMEYNTRDIFPVFSINTHQNNYGRYNYYDRQSAHYFIGSYPWMAGDLFFYDGLYNVHDGAIRENTISMILHSPPKQVNKYVVAFRNCWFIETSNMFWMDKSWWNAPLDVSKYKANDISMRYLSEPLTIKEPQYLCKPLHTYVIFDNDNPDKDFQLKIDAPSYPGFASSPGPVTKLFEADVEYGIIGDILVDSNNDGFLGGEDNAVEQIEPGCVFWVNDDDESNESTIHPNDADAANDEFSKDYEDDAINGIRDLEDFMPINIAIPNITEWTNNQNVRMYLKAEGDGKIRIFGRVQDIGKEDERAYIRELGKSIKQYKETVKLVLPASKKEDQILDSQWFNSEGKFYGIYEGVKQGKVKLILSVEIDSGKEKQELILDEANLTIVDVKSMFKVYNTRYTALHGNEEGPTYSNDDKYYRYRVIREQGGYGKRFPVSPDRVMIWTHGYNNSEFESLKNIETIFKRLYVTGYRDGFVGVVWHVHRWQDEYGITDRISWLNFNVDWERCYRTGHVFADIIRNIKGSYPDATLNVFVHSLGANLGCYTLRLLSENNDVIVDNLILHEAAAPEEVFCGKYSAKGRPYRLGYFDNIYAESLKAVKGKVYNTYCPEDAAVWAAFPLNNALFSLPTPLDEDYRFINNAIMSTAKPYQGGLGSSRVKTIYNDKIMSSNQFKSLNEHPYGIRKHGSQSDEYYYDVMEFYRHIINPDGMPDDVNNE